MIGRSPFHSHHVAELALTFIRISYQTMKHFSNLSLITLNEHALLVIDLLRLSSVTVTNHFTPSTHPDYDCKQIREVQCVHFISRLACLL